MPEFIKSFSNFDKIPNKNTKLILFKTHEKNSLKIRNLQLLPQKILTCYHLAKVNPLSYPKNTIINRNLSFKFLSIFHQISFFLPNNKIAVRKEKLRRQDLYQEEKFPQKINKEKLIPKETKVQNQKLKDHNFSSSYKFQSLNTL